MFEKRVFGPFKHGAGPAFQRADLEIYGINIFRPSYIVYVFFNDPKVNEASASEDRDSYAGTFAIFGHQRCSGDEGHCEVHPAARRFDDRPSHPLTRAFKRVVITDALRRCLDAGELTITLVASYDAREADDSEEPLMDFQGMQITTFR